LKKSIPIKAVDLILSKAEEMKSDIFQSEMDRSIILWLVGHPKKKELERIEQLVKSKLKALFIVGSDIGEAMKTFVKEETLIIGVKNIEEANLLSFKMEGVISKVIVGYFNAYQRAEIEKELFKNRIH
jgi:UDP-N-acetylmuramoylalanine-D-glutamate ligase